MRFVRVGTVCSICGANLFRSVPIYLASTLKDAKEARCGKCETGSKWLNAEKIDKSFERVSTACAKLEISTRVLDASRELYRVAQQRGVLKGRAKVGVLAASLYAVCRQERLPIRGRDLANACKVDVTEFNRIYRVLRSSLDLEVPRSHPSAFLPGLGHKLAVSSDVIGEATRLLKQADSGTALTGKDPVGLAAAATYIACILTNFPRGQKEIAKAAGVTEVTLRHSYKTLMNSLSVDLKQH